jgi:hypothetical protein
MLKLDRILHFLRRLLGVTVGVVLIAFMLAFITVLAPRLPDAQDDLLEWRFWATVGLSMLPSILAVLLSLSVAGRFVQVVHKLASWREGVSFIIRSRLGQLTVRPWIVVEKGRISIGQDSTVARIGGPGSLIIGRDSAVLLVRGSLLTRVVGPGLHKLEAFERVYDIVDLRPKRSVRRVRALTREGIGLSWDVEIRYEFLRDPEARFHGAQYTFLPDAVLRAATGKWAGPGAPGRGRAIDWERKLVDWEADTILRSIVARYSLNDIVGIGEADAGSTRERIRAELAQALRQVAPALSATVLEVNLQDLSVDNEVIQQWIRFWQARWERWSAGELAEEEAEGIRQREAVRGEAQIRMLQNIILALEQQATAGAISPQAINRIVVMRLFDALEGARVDATTRVFVPAEALEMLNRLREQFDGSRKPGDKA